jgi:hypothetical protein
MSYKLPELLYFTCKYCYCCDNRICQSSVLLNLQELLQSVHNSITFKILRETEIDLSDLLIVNTNFLHAWILFHRSNVHLTLNYVNYYKKKIQYYEFATLLLIHLISCLYCKIRKVKLIKWNSKEKTCCEHKIWKFKCLQNSLENINCII